MNPIDAPARLRPRTAGPVHRMFGVNYASHDVLNRTLLQDMPTEWQHRYVALRREFGAAHVEAGAVEYKVLTGRWHYPEDLDPRDRRRCGVTHHVADGACGMAHAVDEDCVDECDPDDTQLWVYLDRHGREVQGEVMFAPAADPIPHYRRGYVPPDLSAPWLRVNQAEQVRLLLSIHDVDAETEAAAEAGEWLPNLVVVAPVVELTATEAAKWSRAVTCALSTVPHWTVETVATRLTNRHFGSGVLVRLPDPCT